MLKNVFVSSTFRDMQYERDAIKPALPRNYTKAMV